MTASQVLKPPPSDVGLRIMSDKLMRKYVQWVKDGRPKRPREGK